MEVQLCWFFGTFSDLGEGAPAELSSGIAQSALTVCTRFPFQHAGGRYRKLLAEYLAEKQKRPRGDLHEIAEIGIVALRSWGSMRRKDCAQPVKKLDTSSKGFEFGHVQWAYTGELEPGHPWHVALACALIAIL